MESFVKTQLPPWTDKWAKISPTVKSLFFHSLWKCDQVAWSSWMNEKHNRFHSMSGDELSERQSVRILPSHYQASIQAPHYGKETYFGWPKPVTHWEMSCGGSMLLENYLRWIRAFFNDIGFELDNLKLIYYPYKNNCPNYYMAI